MISNKIITKESFMELVYLWVEKYKNIVGQEFNFSPRFKCEYNEEKNELTINENKNYVSIFPDNINITAIVGENGSGKSSILFQDERGGEGFANNCKIFFNRNEFILHEPYKEFFEENEGPYIIPYIIKNNTTYRYIQKSIYNNLTFNNKKEYIQGAPLSGDLDDKFSLHFNWDFFKYFSKENYYEGYSYGAWKDNPNIFMSLISKDKYDISYQYFLENIQKNILNFIRENEKEAKIFFEHFAFKILSEIPNNTRKIDIFHLSHGERFYFLLFFILIFECFEKKTDLIIYLDEPDLSLHPQWQKNLIKKIIEIFSIYSYKIHIIITSHSPFILSDLPKENIIFLEKGKQVYPFDDGKQTFGANIHTLLSHGFFMKDGLMGEFAKSKIDLAIKYLNQKVLTPIELDYCENIISIIGEPIIKRELQKMLDSKKLSEIEQIKKEIKALEERMTLIWKNSK